MTSFLGIDSDVWVVILTIIIAIETLYLIIQEKRRSSSEIVKKVSNSLDLKLPLAREKLYNFIAILVLYVLFPLLIYLLGVWLNDSFYKYTAFFYLILALFLLLFRSRMKPNIAIGMGRFVVEGNPSDPPHP